MEQKETIPVSFPAELFWKNGLTPIETDPFGSYTGVPEQIGDTPVQDADDL